MKFLMVLWLGWSCPGGWLSGLVPAAARPVLCRPVAEYERFDPARRAQAHARVREQGGSARLFSCDAARCREVSVRWKTEAVIEEAP